MGSNDTAAAPGAEKRKERVRGWLIAAGGAAAFAWVWWQWTGAEPPLAGPLDLVGSHGERGDAFGRINALFSGLAFAGVIVAILLQREELRLQRRELEETRKELRRQADAAEKQEVALEAQRRAMLLSAAVSGIAAQLQSIEAERSRTDPMDAARRTIALNRNDAQLELAFMMHRINDALGLVPPPVEE